LTILEYYARESVPDELKHWLVQVWTELECWTDHRHYRRSY